MCTFQNLNESEATFLKKTRRDEIKNLKHQTEKHDHEKILKSVEIDNE